VSMFAVFATALAQTAGQSGTSFLEPPESKEGGRLIAAGALEGFAAAETETADADMQCLDEGFEGGAFALFDASVSFLHTLTPVLVTLEQDVGLLVACKRSWR
ncbi:unnamed protein product, partial [Polarella glacialis]